MCAFYSPFSSLSALVGAHWLAYTGCMARKTLLIVPPHRLDAFSATGVLADLLRAEAHVPVEIICRESDVALFQAAPGALSFIPYKDDAAPGFGLMTQTMGRAWHRIIALTPIRLPFLLWAKHRHFFRYEAGCYALPSLLKPGQTVSPYIWVPDRLHLALPQTLAPTAPLILFATEESGRADWGWQQYAELSWRLADCIPALQKAHIVVLSPAGCPIAQTLMENIPAGQISRFENLAYAKQAALMRRAAVLVGTDRLAARMAPYAGCALTLRLDRHDITPSGRPYGLYIGHDPQEVAAYIQAAPMQKASPQTATKPQGSAMTPAMSEAQMRALAAQMDRINNE